VDHLHLIVDNTELAALAARAPVMPSVLFPWDHNGSPEPVEGELGAAITAIAAARACVRLRAEGAGNALHYGAWFGADAQTVALRPFDEYTVVERTQPDLVTQFVTDILGGSSLRTVDVDLELPAIDALLLAIAIDEARRDGLMALAMNVPFVPRGIASGDAPRMFDDVASRDSGLAGLLVVAAGEHLPAASAADVLDALDRLVASELLAVEGDRFVPTGAVRELARHCLGATARVELVANWIADDRVERAALHAAQFGVYDLVVVEWTSTHVRFATESAANVVDHVHAFLSGAPLELAR
jgi:hypothetical protein